MSIYTDIFEKLKALGITQLINNGAQSAKSVSPGFMDLCLDVLETDGQTARISLAHYFKQNGDLCADPDMEIRVYLTTGWAEALTFQMAIPPIYQVVYPEPGKVCLSYKKELNTFLRMWLSNAMVQGHKFIES